ncbi:hypothetical protein P2G88_06285 [Aliiglaciecola sp. CAU 1673]|uniref:hypothetical protein n=1 Tax=Aliiglaciecola sp. CAU 1673 TaxID=3032595 RepID=UPI0023DB3958|nr:hypothetical protein [Aliiglaciecola sp. CAU 1673]MDF2177854.1 hypothetical protein [Aliiglaciecola sp. CAU 1673]
MTAKQSGLLALLLVVLPVMAQEPVDEDAQVLKLETTIRGDKEQPRVMSLVPWQLPRHRTVQGPGEWTPALNPPKPLERNAFMAEQRLWQRLGAEHLGMQDAAAQGINHTEKQQ